MLLLLTRKNPAGFGPMVKIFCFYFEVLSMTALILREFVAVLKVKKKKKRENRCHSEPCGVIQHFFFSSSFSVAQMELDRSADPPPAIWVSTTKSSVNKWVSMRDTSEISEDLTT